VTRRRAFRIVTYNVHKCRGIDGRVRPARIAEVLADLEADVIALQEVVSHEGRTAGDDQARFLATELGYFWAMAETRKHRGGAYGNVTLSRWDFDLVRPIDVSVRGRERRAALRTDLRFGDDVVHLFNVHLGTGPRERRTQARRLMDADLLKAVDLRGPRIVFGDFNDWAHGLVTSTLTREFHFTDLRQYLRRVRSYPGVLPLVHLDHIYLDPHLRVERAYFLRSPRARLASDHLPLVADVQWVDRPAASRRGA
jgi:endonuclease/exonuclease/phosphatase family metal-dependent hydrolase